MTQRRVTRLVVEALNADPSPQRRVTRLVAEVLNADPSPQRRTTRLVVEVLQSLTVDAPSAPDAPANPDATAASFSSILVEWDDTVDETGYRVERSDDGLTGWTDVSGDLPADTVSYLDTGLDPVTQYFYRIFAFNGFGESDPSDVVDATTSTPPTPDQPDNVTATVQTFDSILVEWDDVSTETGYRVERSLTGVGGWSNVSGSLPADTISYLDTGLTGGTQYFYRIFAFNGTGDSPASDVVDATTPLTPPPVPPTGLTVPWLEVWSRPGAVDYGKKIADLPFTDASVTVPYSGVGKGNMTVPANFDRLDEIIHVDVVDSANSVWSTIKVFDDTGWLYEWLPSPRVPADSKTGIGVDFAGDGLEAMWSFARVEPWDWNGEANFASTFPDWIYGGRNLLSNPGFEDSGESPIIDEFWITDATAGTVFLSDGVNNTSPIDWDENNPAVIEAALEAAGIYDDCLVAGSGTVDDPFVIEAVDPFEGVTLTVGTGLLVGGTADIRRVQFGSLQPSGWTRSTTVSAGVPRVFGEYDSFRVTTEQAHSGSYSLRIDPALVESNGVRYAGTQQVVTVRPGGVYQARVWVYPTSATDTYRFIIRGIDGDFIKASPGGLTSTVLTANTWNELVIEDVPVGSNSAVIFRIATTVPVGVDPAVFYVDDAEFDEGMTPTTVGCMLEQLYADATADHAPDRIVWQNEAVAAIDPCYLTLDFDCDVDSNGTAWDRDDVTQTFKPRMSYGQVIDQIVEEGGYEWRVVPADVAAGTYLLQVFNPGDLGSVKDAGIIAGARDTARSARIFAPSSTAQLAEGEDSMSARVENAGLVATFGRIEGSILDRNWTTFSSLSSAAIMQNTEQLRGAESVAYTLASPSQRPLVLYRPGDRIYITDTEVFAAPGPGDDPRQVRRVSQIQLSMSKGQTDEFVVHISDAIPFRFIGGAGVKLARGLTGQAATDNAVAALLDAYKRTESAPIPSTRIFGGGGQPTVTVAAANATDTSKGKADLTCDGNNDDQMIQQAFEMLGGRGGKVVLTEGDFHFGLVGVICPDVPFHLHGMGPDATRLISDTTAAYMFLDGTTTGQENQQRFSDMTLDGAAVGVTSITAVSTLGSANHVFCHNLKVTEFTSHGITLPRPAGMWRFNQCWFFGNGGNGLHTHELGLLVTDCVFQANAGNGLYIDVNDAIITGNRLRANTLNGIGTGNVTSGSANSIIANNQIISNGAYGIHIQHGDDHTITGNLFEANSSGSIGLGAGAFGVTNGSFVTGNHQPSAGTFVTASGGSSAIESNNVVNGALVP